MSTWRVYGAYGDIIEQGSNAAANAHDGNTSTYYTLYNPYYYGDFGMPYIIEEDFGQTVTITQFKVYVTNTNDYNQVRVEYWTGSQWSLVGIANINNTWNTFNGSWTTSKWRVLWDGDPYEGDSVRVNEMQAVAGTTTINVSDSGTGAESVVKFVDGAMEVVDSGTGTESATKITFGSTWTVYSGQGNILEQGSNAAANAHDDNTTTYYTLYMPYAYNQPYIIEEDFGQTLTVTQFKVYATYVDEFNQIKVEYWTGSAWSLVGYVTTVDTWTTFSGSWTTSKWRVSWSGTAYYTPVRVGEMQAVLQPPTFEVSDSGTGAETAVATTLIAKSDSGTGSETVLTLTTVVVSDTGTGTDRITNRTFLNLMDTGNGVEFVSLSETLITITDSGSGSEAVVSIPYIFVTDSGWGNEASASIATFYLTDTGGGIEELLMDLEVYDASGLSGEEIALVFGQIDDGLGTEGLPLRLVGVLDGSMGEETSTLIVVAKDNGVGRELVVITNLLSASDEGFGQEKPLRVIHVGAFVFLRPD
jgi:hypothetical protein